MVSVIHPVIPLQPVVCEQCGEKQLNRVESGQPWTKRCKGYAPCTKCGHPYGRYAEVSTIR